MNGELSKSGHAARRAPALHAPLGTAVNNLRHLEWFTDHARLEPGVVLGAPQVRGGHLTPRFDDLGHGMSLHPTATTYRIQ